MSRNWVDEAKKLFRAEKPEHFTDFRHCSECAEHDEALRNATIDGIGMEELGNPAWDPVCMSTVEGRKYYMPAFVRLSLETVENDFYFEQFLFHLEGGGVDDALVTACNEQQRRFLADFIEYMILTFPEAFCGPFDADNALRVHDIWTAGDRRT